MSDKRKTSRRFVRPLWIEGVSAIVPVANDAQQLSRFLTHLTRCAVLEVLVCDMGSTDETCAIARGSGAHVFRTAGSLSDAFNKAAFHARGSALWFLSPAVQPPRQAGYRVLDALAVPDVAAGFFPAQSARLSLTGWCRTGWWNQQAFLFHRIRLEHAPFVSHAMFARTDGCPEGPRPLAAVLKRIRKDRQVVDLSTPVRVWF